MTEPRLLLHLHKAEPVVLATDPESRWLVTGAWDTYAHVVDLRDGRVLLREGSQFVHLAAQRPAFLLTNRGEWRLVEFDPGHEFEAIAVHERDKAPRDLAFDSSGRFIATAGPDGVWLVDRESRAVRTLSREPTLRVRFNRDGTRLHAVGPNALQAWHTRPHEGGLDFADIELPSRGTPPFRDLQTAGLSADGDGWLAVRWAANGDSSWIRGRFDSVAIEPPIPFARGGTAPEVSADGRWLAWGTWGAEKAGVTVRRLGSESESQDPPVWIPGSGTATGMFSPDTRVLVVGDSEQVRLYEVGTWRLLRAFPRRPIQPLPPQFAFSSDGRLCAATLPPDRVLLLDTVNGEELATLPASPHLVSRAAFSPDDRILAAGCTDHHVLLWDLEATRGRLKELGLNW
jgi:WD40 repeat protein